jgi:hypothetical protein
MTKEEALEELKQSIYPEDLFRVDYEFVLKKLGFTHEAFQKYIKAPQIPHNHYDMSLSIFDEVKWLKKIKSIFKK